MQLDAFDGLPVKGMEPTWEAGRPTMLTDNAKADKERGFVQYERKPLGYRPAEERIHVSKVFWVVQMQACGLHAHTRTHTQTQAVRY